MINQKDIFFHGAPITFWGSNYNAIENLSKLQAEKFTIKKALIITDVNLQKTDHFEKFCKKWTTILGPIEQLHLPSCEPTCHSINNAVLKIKNNDFDIIIGYGGGSVMDSAKIISVLIGNCDKIERLFRSKISVNRNATLLLIPTTAGTGSEMSPVSVILKDNQKEAIYSQNLRADIVFIDYNTVKTCSTKALQSSGIDAFVHAIESLVSANSNFISSILSHRSVKIIFDNLNLIFNDDKSDRNFKSLVQGILLSTVSFGYAGCGGIHALAYPLCGSFSVSHGEANSLMFLSVLGYNILNSSGARSILFDSLIDKKNKKINENDKVYLILKAIQELLLHSNLPKSLKEIGVKENDIDWLSKRAMGASILLSNNPVDLDPKMIHKIYRLTYNNSLDLNNILQL